MLGIYYIVISILFGLAICLYVFPSMYKVTTYAYDKYRIKICRMFFYLPLWYTVGTLIVTWLTYIVGYLYRGKDNPLMYANAIIIPIISIFTINALIFRQKKLEVKKIMKDFFYCKKGEIIYMAFGGIVVIFLICFTFFKKDGILYVGNSVFSDFSPHIGMIRSFSVGNNFPTMYSHFTGEDIKYHFMYHFMVGNLEFLGLPIDLAFNIPSIMSLLFVLFLLYILAVRITGNYAVGYLSGIFFLFRSSSSFFLFISEHGLNGIISAIANNYNFIGYTPNENWGLWNLNVYANQRHFPFSICVMLIVIIVMLPKVYNMWESLNEIRQQENKTSSLIGNFIVSTYGWKIRDSRKVITLGIFLGMIGFFNGAVFIATLLILFFMAIISESRLEYLVIALIAGVLSLIQSSVFINESVISPTFFYGFIAENKTLIGTMEYVIKLMGIFPFLLAFIFFLEKGVHRILIIIFSIPIIFSFTVSLTIDVTVNHKYIMLSIMLLNIFIANGIVYWIKQGYVMKLICVILCILMTATGIYDLYTYFKQNYWYGRIELRDDDALTKWIIENIDSKDILLTHTYALNEVVYGGGMLYYGWPYYAWSAGYDTKDRQIKVKQMYEASTKEELVYHVEKNNIDYIIVDYNNRVTSDYILNEHNIRESYEVVFEDGEGDLKRTVYDMSKPR